MSTSSPDGRDIEVNVVSSPESGSRNNSPEPNFRLITPSITCFPVIKTTSDDDEDDKNDRNVAKVQQKSSANSTNFSISSILSRTEPAVKKNGLFHNAGQTILENNDSAMLSR